MRKTSLRDVECFYSEKPDKSKVEGKTLLQRKRKENFILHLLFDGRTGVFQSLLYLGICETATQNKNMRKSRLVSSQVMVLAEEQGKHTTAVQAGPLSASVYQRTSPVPCQDRTCWEEPLGIFFSFKIQASMNPGMPP